MNVIQSVTMRPGNVGRRTMAESNHRVESRSETRDAPDPRRSSSMDDDGSDEPDEKLPTGIDALDRMLKGGLPYGTLAVLTASPASSSELLLHEFVSDQETVYLTTERSETAVRNALEKTKMEPEDVEIRSMDDDDSLPAARRTIEELSERVVLVIDPMRRFEHAEESAYRDFLNALEEWAVETQSVVFLHCLEGRGVTDRRDLTEYIADVIFTLETRVTGDHVENRLAITKFRGGEAFDGVIKLDLTEGVDIDMSRKIA